MSYDPLPEWEQIRKPKELPFWWDNIESVPIAKAAQKGPREYQGMTGMEMILCCLSKHPRLSCSQLKTHIGYNRSSIMDWLNKLLQQGKVTYEVRSHNRFWRLAHPDEPQPVLSTQERTGTMQKRLLRHFWQQPDRWFSPHELQQLLKDDRIEKLIKSLHSLYLAGKIERCLDPAPHRHPYQYRGRRQPAPVAGSEN